MNSRTAYFFCGIGGSGMLPLSLIVKAGGADVSGSDRALDQGRTAQKFAFLRSQGITLYPQDGSGVTRGDLTVVTSAAVEETVPDVQAARRIGARVVTRASVLAALFNEAPMRIGVAGTSGKSTTTGMIGWILEATGRHPTIVNGAVMKNFITQDAPFASAVVGERNLFVCEVDESDGSISQYRPRIAVLNNVALDHKSLDELRALFRAFVAGSEVAVLNLDNPETAGLAREIAPERLVSWSASDAGASLSAADVMPQPDGIVFALRARGRAGLPTVALKVPGRHNLANAMAALAACEAAGIDLAEAAWAIESFSGIRRRCVGGATGRCGTRED